MTRQKPHFVGLGNALVDVVAPVAPDLIARHGLAPGAMHLVGEAEAHALFDEVAPGVRQSGGSVANSVAHAAEIGARTTYLGKAASDPLGDTFREEMAALGVAVPIPAVEAPGTGRCVVLVTPDGERTMSTYLGAAVTLGPDDIRAAYPAQSDVLLVEGYVWDAPEGAAVIAAAVEGARASGARIALSPSDPGCIARNLEAMRGFVSEVADIFVGNRAEAEALSGTSTAADALAWAREHVAHAAVTESEHGAHVADGRVTAHVPAVAVPRVVDSTGAGDAFAAGFLCGLAGGASAPEAARRGAQKAARILGHYGARNGPAAEALSISAA